MKSLSNFINEQLIEEAGNPQKWVNEITTLGGFANFINCFPGEWEKYKDEIMNRCGWVESDREM